MGEPAPEPERCEKRLTEYNYKTEAIDGTTPTGGTPKYWIKVNESA